LVETCLTVAEYPSGNAKIPEVDENAVLTASNTVKLNPGNGE